MPNNVVIKGFNALRKVITQGYSQFTGGVSVRICRLYTRKYICQNLNSNNFICQSLETDNFICQRLRTK